MNPVRLFRDALSSYSSYSITHDEIQTDEKGRYKVKEVVSEVPCSCHPETCCHFDGKQVATKTEKVYIKEELSTNARIELAGIQTVRKSQIVNGKKATVVYLKRGDIEVLRPEYPNNIEDYCLKHFNVEI